MGLVVPNSPKEIFAGHVRPCRRSPGSRSLSGAIVIGSVKTGRKSTLTLSSLALSLKAFSLSTVCWPIVASLVLLRGPQVLGRIDGYAPKMKLPKSLASIMDVVATPRELTATATTPELLRFQSPGTNQLVYTSSQGQRRHYR